MTHLSLSDLSVPRPATVGPDARDTVHVIHHVSHTSVTALHVHADARHLGAMHTLAERTRAELAAEHRKIGLDERYSASTEASVHTAPRCGEGQRLLRASEG